MKSCPRCRVQHLDTADLCDCGYRFSTGSVDRDRSAPTKSRPIATALTWLVILVVAGIAGSIARNLVRSGAEAVASGGMEIEDMLLLVAKDLNATLPTMVDSATRLDRVSAGPGKKVTYHYSLVTINSSDVTQRQLTESMQNRVRTYVCTAPDMSTFREKKVVVVYSYRGMDGGFIGDITTSPRDCT